MESSDNQYLAGIEFQDKTKLFSYSEKSLKFYEKWMSDESFQYINTTMRSIRKVQNDCSLLKMCSTDKMIMNELHDGFIFDKTQKEDLLFKYMVYIPKLKMVNRFMTRHDIQNNSKHEFRLFTFKDEDKLKEKIRIERSRAQKYYREVKAELLKGYGFILLENDSRDLCMIVQEAENQELHNLYLFDFLLLFYLHQHCD